MGETACGPHQAPLAEEQPSSSCVSPSPEQPASRRSLRRALSSLYAPSFLDQDTLRPQILGDIQNQGLVRNQDVGAGGSNE